MIATQFIPDGFTLKRRWRFIRRIGQEPSSEVYTAFDFQTNAHVAVRVEVMGKMQQLSKEASVLNFLAKQQKQPPGIPKVIWTGTDKSEERCGFLVTEHLGPSLAMLLRYCGGRFRLKTVLMIADATLELIEFLHSANFVHRNINLSSLIMGMYQNSHVVHLTNFGHCQLFCDPKTSCHSNYKEVKEPNINGVYLSINGHAGIELSRRDDLESLGYVLIHMLGGGLPWIGVDGTDKAFNIQKIGERKRKFPVELYCKEMPEEFSIYMNYVRNLAFEEKPDYFYLRKLFNRLFKSCEFEKDFVYDWVKPDENGYRSLYNQSGVRNSMLDSQTLVPGSHVSDLGEKNAQYEKPPSPLLPKHMTYETEDGQVNKPTTFGLQKFSKLKNGSNVDFEEADDAENKPLITDLQIAKPTNYLAQYQNSEKESEKSLDETH